ncbi:MAG TPA: S41 family peptidase, partial [Nannocystaceae bacterium]|nr:S41 family peptidase [Nannocystaceae bacterium]
GLRLGFIRIPSYSPSAGTGVALQQFDAEIAYFQDNTDGLIIDEMRNPGGSVLYVEQLCQRVINYPFRSIGFELRVLGADVSSFGPTLTAARTSGQPDWVVAGYEARFNDVLSAYEGLRGRTGPISLTQSSLDLQPLASAYTKPLIVLVDDFSASGGDAFPATELAAADGAPHPLPALTLHLDPARLGPSPRYGASWRERVDALRRRLGDPALLLLESLLRVADIRASIRATADPALVPALAREESPQ